MATSIFDVIGPVMVGPSSSHTAGAVRIGFIANQVAGGVPARSDFYLHGSFAETYQGHGTDKALVGGVLGMSPDDEQLRNSLRIALLKGMVYNFNPVDLGNVHPNTVKIVMHTHDGNIHEVVGSSTGGGGIVISSIDNAKVEFTNEYPTILTIHEDKPGVIASLTDDLAQAGINVAFLKVFRSSRGSDATMVVETDNPIPVGVLKNIDKIEGIKKVIFIDKTNDKARSGQNVSV